MSLDQVCKIICSLPNASEEINGIAFEEDKGDMVAINVPADKAERFANIQGYEVIPQQGKGTGNEDPEDVKLEDMKVGEIVELLKVEPESWPTVLSTEEVRDKQREGVLNAVATAKASLEGTKE